MDKSIFTALNSMQILKNNQSVTSQNLSNTNVPGFKKDIHCLLYTSDAADES